MRWPAPTHQNKYPSAWAQLSWKSCQHTVLISEKSNMMTHLFNHTALLDLTCYRFVSVEAERNVWLHVWLPWGSDCHKHAKCALLNVMYISRTLTYVFQLSLLSTAFFPFLIVSVPIIFLENCLFWYFMFAGIGDSLLTAMKRFIVYLCRLFSATSQHLQAIALMR